MDPRDESAFTRVFNALARGGRQRVRKRRINLTEAP